MWISDRTVIDGLHHVFQIETTKTPAQPGNWRRPPAAGCILGWFIDVGDRVISQRQELEQ